MTRFYAASAVAVAFLGLTATAPAQASPHPFTSAFSLHFEANGGQFHRSAPFVARGRGYQLFVTPDGVTLTLRDPAAGDRFAAAVRTRFVGANPAPAIRGEAELPTRVHYLVGRDAGSWSTNNRTFARVRYAELWPGVDAVLYERGGELEYDFVIAPGADPGAIRLRYEGVNALRIHEHGHLVLQTDLGDITHSAPVLYQGEGQARHTIDGRFVLHSAGTVGFEVDAYDRTRPLVIDPVLVYASYLGGTGNDTLTDIATDQQGCAYVCGATDSTDLPGTAGTFQPAKQPGDTDALIAKISADGTTLLWCTYLGGSDVTPYAPQSSWDDDRAFAIDVDASGHAYVGGQTACVDFPTTAGALQVGRAGVWDGFVTKLTPDGDGLVYSTYLGSSWHDRVRGLMVDGQGHAFLTGSAGAPTFPVTSGAFQTGASFSVYGGPFVAKLAPGGNGLVYSTFLAGTNEGGSGEDIHVDSSGRVYVAGTTLAADFPTVNALQPTLGGQTDGFLVRLSADGSTMEYGTYLGGAKTEGFGPTPAGSHTTTNAGVAADNTGRAWFVSYTVSTDFPTTPGALRPQWTPMSTANRIAVVSCLDTDAAGTASVVWSTYLGDNSSLTDTCMAVDVEVDSAQNAYVLGYTNSTSFPVVAPWQTRPPQTQHAADMFLTIFDAAGAVPYSTYFGGDGAEITGSTSSARLSLDSSGNILIAGGTTSNNLATPGAFQTTNPTTFAGGQTKGAGFVAKFTAIDSYAAVLVRTPCFGSAPTDSLRPLTGPVLGQRFSIAIDDPTGGAGLTPGLTVAYAMITGSPDPGYPCGTPIPGFGLGGGLGEILIAFAPSLPIFLPHPGLPWAGPGSPTIYSFVVPPTPSLNAARFFKQGAFLDLNTSALVLTDAVDLTLGL